MNLPDLVRRSDRAVKLTAGCLTPTVLNRNDEPRSVVVMDPGTEITLQRADEFRCLQQYPSDIGWQVWSADDNADPSPLGFLMEIVTADAPSEVHTMFRTNGGASSPVTLDWPGWAARGSPFHLRLANRGQRPLVIDTGVSFNSRAKFFPLLKGNGVEIGPGLNPHILPSDTIDIRYVESASAEEWVRNYKKTDKPSVVEQKNLWSKYIVADAQVLAPIPDGSLNFIYSNHVFEHLMNPLGVLENWRRKLAPAGIIVGVVPDCRYTFDLRQAPTTQEEWLDERSKESWKTERQQYERWCRYTAPYNTPENLIERNYSIHVHYYSPESFRLLAQLTLGERLFEEFLMETSRNHKDFGFLLRAPAE